MPGSHGPFGSEPTDHSAGFQKKGNRFMEGKPCNFDAAAQVQVTKMLDSRIDSLWVSELLWQTKGGVVGQVDSHRP